jgi:glycosyltransferase involved in cell wall biosynthesis
VTTALVHDYLLVLRGAERTFAAIADEWPDSPIYTTLYDEKATRGRFATHDVRTSFLQRTGATQESFRRLLPLFPAAVARLPVAEHDVVISSSSAFAHGVRAREGAVHVCYCHSPFRYVWHERGVALSEMPRPLRPVGSLVLRGVRRWDLAAAHRVTHYVANGEITRRRIQEFYGRDAPVIHPPVELDRFAANNVVPDEWLLIVCALVRHKRVDRALAAARAAGRRVKVVGEGPERERWQHEFGDVAEFLGRLDDATLTSLYQRAQALIVPNVEEFGITAVEAQAAGRPVLAIDGGGARETVVPGVTGELVAQDELAEAMRGLDFTRYDPGAARANAERFSEAAFRAALRAEVERAVAGH